MSKAYDIFLTNLDKMVKWAENRSLWPLSFGLSCCAIEMMHAAASRIDLDRYGCLFRSSPRQADLLIVSGTVTYKMVDLLKNLYEQMLEPRRVIAMGSCAISGGLYCDSPFVVQGVDKIIPVDVCLIGCPPRPEELARAIIEMKNI
ncbi:MAG: NADH-quinone oxidoreductase subunit NuoB [Holosporales bacterium]|nr:NADH-quinone oxidoreductase subunit NuoB [Holosporales bacterium]